MNKRLYKQSFIEDSAVSADLICSDTNTIIDLCQIIMTKIQGNQDLYVVKNRFTRFLHWFITVASWSTQQTGQFIPYYCSQIMLFGKKTIVSFYTIYLENHITRHSKSFEHPQ